ncbi:MAG TPA: hypothetical protein VK116_17655, partial [Planctomycetota bacterium]|nr:hypothetical protein [Planctomycetota bacterium]
DGLSGSESCAMASEGYLAVYVRGDCSADAEINISDAVVTLQYLFLGSGGVHCLDSCDANADEKIDISDPIRTLSFLFGGGPPLPSPFPDCGLLSSLGVATCSGMVCP